MRTGRRLTRRDGTSHPVKAAHERFNISDFWTWAFLLCATLAAYWPALRGGLVWDDDRHVTSPELQSVHGLWRIWFDLGATQQYYPFLHSAFWIEHSLWGDAALGYHLTNIVLHSLSAWLIVLIMRRLSLPGALLAGFVFALHPVYVEAVAWIAEQKSTLSGVFYLLSALTYLRFDRTRRGSTYLLATGWFVLALLTKTVTATLPAALLVVLWWERGKLEVHRDLRPLVPWLFVGAAAGLFTAWVERTIIGAAGTDFVLTLLQRLLLANRAIVFYAGTFLRPTNLIFQYPHWNIEPTVWWQYLFPCGVVTVGVGVWWVARRHHRAPLAGFLMFVGTLFPVLGFLNVYPFRFSYVADHFQYLASLGILVPVTAAVAIAGGPSWLGAVKKGVLVGVPVILGVLTWQQSRIYRDAETLYRQTLLRNPQSWLAHNNLGNVLALLPGRLPDAVAEYQAAVGVKPDLAEAHNNLGTALARIPGRQAEAIAEFTRAEQLKPDFAEAHFNLGRILSERPGRTEDAIAAFQAALHLRPDYAEAHIGLGRIFSSMSGRVPDAVAEYQAALRVKPDLAGAHVDLGNAFSLQPGGLPRAIGEFQTALALAPDDPEAHVGLGRALSLMPGRLSDAIAQYQAALQVSPDYAEAHNNLGNALSQLPDRLPDAIHEFQAALRVKPDLVDAHNNLGNALSLVPGHRTEAIAEYQAALRLNPNYAEAHFNLGSAWSQVPGRLPDAIAEYQAALRLNPDYAKAHNNLGNALALIPGRSSEAIAQYQAALRANPNYAEAHYNLGNALSRIPGRLKDAVAEFREALRIRPDFEQARAALRLTGSSFRRD